MRSYTTAVAKSHTLPLYTLGLATAERHDLYNFAPAFLKAQIVRYTVAGWQCLLEILLRAIALAGLCEVNEICVPLSHPGIKDLGVGLGNLE